MVVRSRNRTLLVAEQVYGLLLATCPAKFKADYGEQMQQTFRDCCLEIQHRRGAVGLTHWWMSMLLDLAVTVFKEHLRIFCEGDKGVNTFRVIAQTVFGCGGIILFLYAMVTQPMPHWNLGVLLCFAIGLISVALILTRSAALRTAPAVAANNGNRRAGE